MTVKIPPPKGQCFYEPTYNGKPAYRYRFCLNIEEVGNDYRPIKYPYPHPWWCTGESMYEFIIVAYGESLDELLEYWPEAIKCDEPDEPDDYYTYSDRFGKPDWMYTTEEPVKDAPKPDVNQGCVTLSTTDSLEEPTTSVINIYHELFSKVNT